MKKITAVLLIAVFVLCSASTALATTDIPAEYDDFIDMVHGMMEAPVDYEGLFALSDGLDGAFSEGYNFEMNRLFDEDPQSFAGALSNQPYEKISHFAYILASEHMQDWDTYRTTLEQSGADEDTLFLMQMGILVVESNTKYSDADYYEQTYPQQVKAHYQENSRLFLLGMPAVGESFYLNVADALIAGLDDAELRQLRLDLELPDESTEAAEQFIAVAHQQIDTILEVDTPDVPEQPDPPVVDDAPTEGTDAPDVPEQPDTPVVDDAPTEGTEPTAPTQTTPAPNDPEQKEETSGYVWIIVAAVVVVIGTVAVIVIKKR